MSPLRFPALLFLLFFGVVVPIGAWRARQRLAALAALPRVRALQLLLAQQVVFGILALMLATAIGIPFRTGRITPLIAVVALSALMAAVVVMRPWWQRAVERGDPRLLLVAPRTADERRWWVAVSVVTGISEELVWRWMFVLNTAWLFGNWHVAVGVSAVLFALAHAPRRWHEALLVAVLAVGLSALVQWSEGVLLAMVLHAAYDLVAGLSAGRMAEGVSR